MSNNLTPPKEKNSGEVLGGSVRDLSLLAGIGCIAVGGLAVTAVPPLLIVAGGGELIRRVSKRLG